METLNDTEWDVIINGTGLSQSLLALALSRSKKKILHVDRNDYYGGSEAAFSLQEAQVWVDAVNKDSQPSTIASASITTPESRADEDAARPKLSFPRAYSIALAPQLIYTDSLLLSTLVKAKVHEQVEFLPVGAWWIYAPRDGQGKLIKVPTNREDIAFSDAGLDLRSKRALVRVIRFIAEYENQTDMWQPFAARPFSDLLREHFKLSVDLHGLLLSLALAPLAPEDTTTATVLPRIAQHLRSTGRLGPGFSAVTPRWGGLSEVCQVACRASAVGGTVYALKQDLRAAEKPDVAVDAPHTLQHYELDNGDQIRGTAVVTGNLSAENEHRDTSQPLATSLTRSVAVVGSALSSLFPEMPSGSPPSAGTVVAFPSGSLPVEGNTAATLPPVYLIIHNQHTGECPRDQCIVYASTSLQGQAGFRHLAKAMDALLSVVSDQNGPAQVLWSMQYEQHGSVSSAAVSTDRTAEDEITASATTLPPLALDLVFDDSVLRPVEQAWRALAGEVDEDTRFMVFAPRSEQVDEDEMY